MNENGVRNIAFGALLVGWAASVALVTNGILGEHAFAWGVATVVAAIVLLITTFYVAKSEDWI